MNRRRLLIVGEILTVPSQQSDPLEMRVARLLELEPSKVDLYVDFVYLGVDLRKLRILTNRDLQAAKEARRIMATQEALTMHTLMNGSDQIILCGNQVASAFGVPTHLDWFESWADKDGHFALYKMPDPLRDPGWWQRPDHVLNAQRFLKSVAPPIAPSHQAGGAWKPMTSLPSSNPLP